MDQQLQAFRAAGERAVRFQLQHQQADGSFIWDPSIRDAYHKQPYSWGISGYLPEAQRLLSWIAANTLSREVGTLRDYGGDVYKHSWFLQGCHRLGRFDLTYPVMSWLISEQRDCGGFPHFAGDDHLRALATAWAGISALYMGDRHTALGAAEWSMALLDQPDADRFYFQTTDEGELLTTEMDPGAQFIDCAGVEQAYWEIALPWMLMLRLHETLGGESWLPHAEAFFEHYLACGADRFACTGSGKGSLAAALHYRHTGDERARAGALEFGEYLLATERPDGGWRGPTEPDTLLIYLDHAAEYNVWLQEVVAVLASVD